MNLKAITATDCSDVDGTQVHYPGLALRILILTVLGLLYYTYYLQGGTPGSHAEILHDLLLWQTCFLPWAVLSPLAWWVERRFPVERRRAALHLVVIAVASIPICYVALEISTFLVKVLEYVFSRMG